MQFSKRVSSCFSGFEGARFRESVLPSTLITLITWFGAPTPAAAQSIIHVPADRPTIQAAIDAAANGDTVLVSDGTYKENIDFKGKAITVKSVNGATLTAIDGGKLSYVVKFTTSEGPKSVLDGFTVTNGFPGGINIGNSSPTVQNNTIAGNDTQGGGSAFFGAFFTVTPPMTVSNNLIIGKPGQSAMGCRAFDTVSPPVFSFNDVFTAGGPNYGSICIDQTHT